MKIGFTGIDIPEGKSKYNDLVLKALAEKDKPKKVSPFFVQFLKDEYVDCDAIVIHKDSLLDILILDMDKIESRINRTADKDEMDLEVISRMSKKLGLSVREDKLTTEEESKLFERGHRRLTEEEWYLYGNNENFEIRY